MWRWLSKYFALRSYRRKLGPALLRRYGRQRHYSVNQVRVTAEKLGLNLDYVCYGIAGFCGEQAFNEYHVGIGEACNYEHMREEVARHHIADSMLSHGHGGYDHGHDDSGQHDTGHTHDSGHGHDSGGHD